MGIYYTYNLTSILQDWEIRLNNVPYDKFGYQLKFFLLFLEKEKILKGLIDEACLRYPLTEGELREHHERITGGIRADYDNQKAYAAASYLLLMYLIRYHTYHKILNKITFRLGDLESIKIKFIGELIAPILYYFNDQLKISTSTLYLLEKYKKRCEWFKKQELNRIYSEASPNFEQPFDDDLRLFLFDQGIDNPFSAPKSSSGKADIVGDLDTSDPLVIEIKIFDRKKNYGKRRIKEGFAQIVKYTNDYNKDFGYLVVFNMDKAEINFKFQEPNNQFPPMVTLNNKTFFFIVIDLYELVSASKVGKLESIEITESDILK